jgi:multicomponent Na+:H+ antiporter subunit G
MTDPGAIAATAVALVATAALTLAVVGLIRIPDASVKVHALSTAVIVGPLLVLAATLLTGQAELILHAVLVGAFLMATAPVSAHAIVRLEKQRREQAGDEE